MERDQEATTWVNEGKSPVMETAMVVPPGATHSSDITEHEWLEDELRQSEWRFRTMFEQAAIGIAFTALDGQLLEVNQRFCDIVGYTREEMLERTFRDITHPDDIEVNEVYLQRLMAGNHPTPSIEKRYIHKDGRIVWVHLTVSLMRDPSNQPRLYMSVIEDITARKQVEEERALLLVREQAARAEAMEHASQLEAVIEAMADGVFIYDAEAHLIRANKTAREIFALDLQPDYSSRPVHDRVSQTEIRNEQGELIPEEQWPMLRIIRGEVFKGTDALDVIIRALDGRDVRLSISGAPVRTAEGRIIGGVLIVRDVTERRLLELALGEANRRMDEFLGVASHELRTPLTSIKGNVQLAKRQLRNLVQPHDSVGARFIAPPSIPSLRPAEAESRHESVVLPFDPAETESRHESVVAGSHFKPAGRFQETPDRPNVEVELSTRLETVQGLLDRAERQIQLLNRLVGDLLDVSRIQANKLELRLELCDLASIVREAVEDQQQMAPTRLIRLELPAEKVSMIADAGAIEQVVTNYLSNALKYSPSERPIEVMLSVEGQAAHLSVHDDGPGLSDSEQERVWERFYRVPGIEVQSGSREGLGLGLHISRTIIERHQGQVGIQSSPGQGSTFWFTLPLTHGS